MSVRDLEVELNKIEGHNPKPQSIDPIEGLPIGQLYKKMLQTIEEFTTGMEWLYSSQIQDLENNLTNTNFLWPNL
ncbi:6039_t:CDS:2 [Gigaspora margarita]|uniref:6039_t:CDS:1 n=1 Tax=Gigaspora margarita TaxID=4874 RepID=A0ABN7UXP0_GIGMA|nr:6039_t:CDS:2 [Gigaspora margarita]